MDEVDWRAKGFWQPGPAISAEALVAERRTLFDGTFTWPLLVVRGTAVERNVGTLAAFCADRGLALAPHGKTTMAPALFAAQLRAGAWAITAATANQVLAYRKLGVPRVLLANQVLDPVVLRWLAAEAALGFEVTFQVDSVDGVEAVTRALPGPGPALPVLVELGFPGGRTGCRTVEQLVAVATAAAAAPRIDLVGVTAYEGGLPDVPAVERFLDDVKRATTTLAGLDLLPDRVVVSAGGSAFFDVVADRLGGAWLPGHTLLTVVRSGAYVTHDDGFYLARTPFRRIDGALDRGLEIWAQVLSVPEPGLAIAGLGKRDVSFDEGLPIPLRVRRSDGTLVPAGELRVTRLNDHHAYVEGEAPLRPGDLLCCGISHPCTAFDKWRVLPVVDDDDLVTGVLHTYF